MESIWGPFGLWLRIYVGLISLWGTQQCSSLNDEGLTLLEFRGRITSDPFAALANWNPNDCNPCKWLGVRCVDGQVQSLVLYKNSFSGTIPKELGDLDKLELLDLRGNDLTGCIPAEIARVLLSKNLLVCDNKFEGSDSQELRKLRLPSNNNNRKFVHQFKLGKATPHAYEEKYCDNLTSSDESEFVQNVVDSARRKLLDQSSNLAAEHFSGGPAIEISSIPIAQSSGAFPAVPDTNKKQNQSPAPLPSPSVSPHVNQASQQNSPNGASGKLWKYIIIITGVAVLVILVVIMLCIWRKRAAKVIKPWKTGISGQLQKAFITGVPKLNRGELETACEDFSNIINSFDECTVYKGTLSSGVEIAVDSTIVASANDWSKNMETAYRKKIAALSRVNHKNFTNLIGYCDEEEPFTRMMVFEYAPNGNLFEHLHVKEVEPLDWSTRMRVIMGTAYCLQYMHHDLNPPVAHSNLNSIAILLTDDFAAKISEISFGKHAKTNTTGDESHKSSELPPQADPETDVYNFGVLLLEIISGKLPYSEEQGHLANWAAEHLNDKQSISYLIDPTLQSFKDEELDVICEVIKDCLQSDPRLRSTMKEITPRLREVLHVSPEQAVPRLSPLWWAELEILSVEAT
uniref:Protein kinase domain-containing protein n=1 Tax=Glycine max TaxID=3847 RepID=A0A0R0IKH9_SOYBN